MMDPFSRIVSAIGFRGTRILVTLSALALIGTAVGIVAWESSQGVWGDGLREEVQSATKVLDSDGDGVADAVENQLGSDPDDAATLGKGVPDGWLLTAYGSGLDWNDTALLDSPALVPPQHELPPALQEPGALPLPTVQDVYEADAEWRDPEQTGRWWISGVMLDPTNWDNNGDGIADAWLFASGIDPLSVGPDSAAPGDPLITIQEKYDGGLDPMERDFDGDGLEDLAEILGVARFDANDHHFDSTDPRRFSSREDGIADGYLVRFGLDPRDSSIASDTPAGDGVSVKEAYASTKQHCESQGAPCDWAQRLALGPLVSPVHWDSLGDGVPDAWTMRDPEETSHPLEDATKIEAYTTAAWDEDPWAGNHEDLVGVVVDGANPAPEEEHIVSLADLYGYQRPGSWAESEMGPWWSGLPTRIDTPPGGLPPAVALRGWAVEIDVGMGRNGTTSPSDDDLRTLAASAHPLMGDTDGDGLTDAEEYFGVLVNTGAPFGRTDPNNPDTDGDGLGDYDELLDWGTDPVRRDTSGSFLTDGKEVQVWQEKLDSALAHAQELARPVFEQEYQWILHADESLAELTVETLKRLGPKGDIDGDGTANVLDRDADGDGLPNGAEVDPRNLGRPSKYVRPATDPEKKDTDGDGLPDPWEIQWSRAQDYSEDLPGWPLDPTLLKSDANAPWATDWEAQLAGDSVRTTAPSSATGESFATFTNAHAFTYGLDPYKSDTSGDGVSDMFGITWGITEVPDFAVEHAGANANEFGWAFTMRDKIMEGFSKRGIDQSIDLVIIDPTAKNQEIDTASNLLGTFPDEGIRDKGTWILDRQPDCIETALPDTGSKNERGGQPNTAPLVPDRSGLPACWQWVEYPLSADIEHGTNPWSHDFDGDGLPDAWEYHYKPGTGLDPAATTRGSRLGTDMSEAGPGSCLDTNLHGGLILPTGRSTFCLTNLDAYEAGIDPNVRDSDGGGLPDWFELALELLPLDPLDDAGQDDWDGDGIINEIEDAVGTDRLSPDTDRDGLLDGDSIGATPAADPEPHFLHPNRGAGDLCLRRGDDVIAAAADGRGGMESRPPSPTLPGDGAMTHSERFDLFVDLGLLHVPAGSRCHGMPDADTEEYHLFKREGFLDKWSSNQHVHRGAGKGTDSKQWDTSGDGMPDGWIVYWRDATSDSSIRNALDPRLGATSDADGDLSTIQEYRWGRPADWKESRDGPWWGGLSPVTTDTDSDGTWYTSNLQARDGLDFDADNDGIPDAMDAFPGIDHANEQMIQWNADKKRYETAYPTLWPSLVNRPATHLLDNGDDGDRIPDVVDRGRVRIDDVLVTRDGAELDLVSKGGQPFSISGRLLRNENPLTVDYTDLGSAAESGAGPVGGATITAVLMDRHGATALIGAGFTNVDGEFLITAQASDSVTAAAPSCLDDDPCASIAGRTVSQGEELSFPSPALLLAPGQVKLHLIAEANDPELQPLCFADAQGDCRSNLTAYKDLRDENDVVIPYRVPLHTPDPTASAMQLRAFALKLDGSGPEPGLTNVRHDAEAIFASVSAPVDLTLQAPSFLTLDAPADALLAGQDLAVAGTLLDAGGAPLPERPVDITVHKDGVQILPDPIEIETDAQGRFSRTLETSHLEPGTYMVAAASDLLPEDVFLEAPEDVETSYTFAQNLRWEDVMIDDRAFVGFPITVDAADPVSVSGRLLDHRDQFVDGRDVTLVLSSPHTGTFESFSTSTQDGVLSFEIPSLESLAPLGPVNLLVATALNPGDTSSDPSIGINPVFPTVVTIDDVETSVDKPVNLVGRLLRTSPDGLVPVANADDDVRFQFVSGNQAHTVATTDSQGRFSLTVDSSKPVQRVWNIQFIGLPQEHLAASEWNSATSTHVSNVVLSTMTLPALRDGEVTLTGSLLLPDDTPLPGLTIEGGWQDGPTNEATTGADGTYELTLGPKDTEGTYLATVRFDGTTTLLPAAKETSIRIRVPTAIDLDAPAIRINPEGISLQSITGQVRDDRGQSLESRRLTVTMATIDHETVLERVSFKDGSFSVHPDDFEPIPGEWTVVAAYAGSQSDAPTQELAEFNVTHEVQLTINRVPARLDPGQTAKITGSSLASATGLGPMHITVTIGGANVGTATVPTGHEWSVPFAAPHLPRDSHIVEARAAPAPWLDIGSATGETDITSLVELEIRETPQADGGRELVLHASHVDGADLVETKLVMVRTAPDGTILGVHDLETDANGIAILQLSPQQEGTLRVVSLADPSYKIASSHHEFKPAATASQPASPGKAWVIVGTLAAAVVLAGAFIAWQHHHRRTLQRLFEKAHESLLDPNASPEEVIRWTYKRTLAALARAGYTPEATHTVRDIAQTAGRAFRLPTGPLHELSQLFEIAVYSDLRMAATHRNAALRCLQQLSRHLEPEAA